MINDTRLKKLYSRVSSDPALVHKGFCKVPQSRHALELSPDSAEIGACLFSLLADDANGRQLDDAALLKLEQQLDSRDEMERKQTCSYGNGQDCGGLL